jgi:hypothetical protein
MVLDTHNAPPWPLTPQLLSSIDSHICFPGTLSFTHLNNKVPRCQPATMDQAKTWVNSMDLPRSKPQRPIPHVPHNDICGNTLFTVLRCKTATQIIPNDRVTLRYVLVEWVPLNKSIDQRGRERIWLSEPQIKIVIMTSELRNLHI